MRGSIFCPGAAEHIKRVSCRAIQSVVRRELKFRFSRQIQRCILNKLSNMCFSGAEFL